MKFVKSFYGCREGETYPVRFQAGDECPENLVAAACSVGAVVVLGGGDGQPSGDGESASGAGAGGDVDAAGDKGDPAVGNVGANPDKGSKSK